jgi:5-methylcytosine-specific restriction endonuclease McrA
VVTKRCSKCKQDKDTSLFYANGRMKDGFNSFCIVCHKADNLARKAKNRSDAKFKAAELAYKKQYRERTVAERAAYMAQWRDANRDRIAKYSKEYRHANKALYNFLCQKRKIDLMNRTPKWLTDDDKWLMSEAYDVAVKRTELTGVEWHVDHIIPLRGKTVSGLHVPLNLRVITWQENQRKTNKYME